VHTSIHFQGSLSGTPLSLGAIIAPPLVIPIVTQGHPNPLRTEVWTPPPIITCNSIIAFGSLFIQPASKGVGAYIVKPQYKPHQPWDCHLSPPRPLEVRNTDCLSYSISYGI
jgi:hypothetical protein